MGIFKAYGGDLDEKLPTENIQVLFSYVDGYWTLDAQLVNKMSD